jgi:hypothetical protein
LPTLKRIFLAVMKISVLYNLANITRLVKKQVDFRARSYNILFAMPIIDPSDIRRDASMRMDLLKRLDELQTLASMVYPGARVVLVTDDERKRAHAIRFENFSGADQIAFVLSRNEGGPMELQALLNGINERGGTMSMETLASLLSRGKDEMFINPSRGAWALSPTFIVRRKLDLPA